MGVRRFAVHAAAEIPCIFAGVCRSPPEPRATGQAADTQGLQGAEGQGIAGSQSVCTRAERRSEAVPGDPGPL
jgi:hypothetical protein